MISIEAAKAAINIAGEFDFRNLKLTADPNTPLAKLVNAGSLGELVLPSSAPFEKDYTPDPLYISSLSKSWSDDETSQHDLLLAGLKKQIGDMVSGHLNFAKNVVRPFIEQLAHKLADEFAGLPIKAESNFEIVHVQMPEPMRSAAFEDWLSEWKNDPYKPSDKYINLGSRTTSEILEYMKTGHKETDESVAIWASRMGESFIVGVWNAVFTATDKENNFASLLRDTDSGVDAAVALFLLSRKLYDNPPEGTGMSLQKYQDLLAEFRKQAALRVLYGYDEFSRDEKLGVLIRKVMQNKIYVNANVYKEWAEETGGNIGVLFGCALSPSPGRTTDVIKDNAAKYLSAWEQNNSILTTVLNNKRFVAYKDITRARVVEMVKNNYDTIYGSVDSTPATVSFDTATFVEFEKGLDAFMKQLYVEDFSNLWELSTRMIGKVVFYYTDSYEILRGIEDAVQANPGINIREAGLISTIKYVTSFVCDQIAVTDLFVK